MTHPLAPLGWGNRFFYRSQRWLGIPLLKLLFRFRTRGDPTPREGPLIVAANHASFLDPVVLQAGVGRRLHFLMTSLYYFHPLLNRYARAMRCIPVMEGKMNREALASGLEVLAAGRCVGVFPQGEIRPEGDLSGGMRGVALLAARARVPVLPVRIRGTGEALPKGGRVPRLVRITLHRGAPFCVSLTAGHGRAKREVLTAAAEAIMEAIRKL